MKKYLLLDYKRVCKNKRLYVVLGIGCLIVLLQFLYVLHTPSLTYWINFIHYLFQQAEESEFAGLGHRYPVPWYDFWIGGEYFSFFSTSYFLLLPLFAVLPFGTESVMDWKKGYVKNLFIREDRKQYYRARFLSSFCIGACVVMLPLVFEMCMGMATKSSLMSVPETGSAALSPMNMWSRFKYQHTFLYELCYLTIIGIFGGLLASFSAGLGFVVDSYLVPIILPFIVWMFASSVFEAFGHPEWAPQNFITPAQPYPYQSFLVMILIGLCLLLLDCVLFKMGETRNEIF